MDFFQRQHQARRKTGLLGFYFLLALVLIIIAINVALYFALLATGWFTGDVSAWLDRPYWWWIAAATLAVVVAGSLASYIRLRDGGQAVAEMVGAQRIDMASKDPLLRRFINVVEEMSIAAGTPVPELYLMEEETGINAFVAGYRPTEAVMVVTRGTLARIVHK